MIKKEKLNTIRSGQLWKSKSEGLSKGNVIKIIQRKSRGYWKTVRVDDNAPKRVPTHAMREWDLFKFYDLL